MKEVVAEPCSFKRERTWIWVFLFSFLGLLIDGADVMLLSYSLTSIKTEFGLTNTEAGSLGSLTLAGMAIGGIYGGWACDRFGRVRTVVWCITIFSLGTALLGLAQSYWQFAIIRFAGALGLGALYIACNTLMAEYVPSKYRTTVLATMQTGWVFGYIAATILARGILPDHGWRYLFFVAIVPIVLTVAMRKLVPEPPIWVKAQAEKKHRLGAGSLGVGQPKPKGEFKMIFADSKARAMFFFWALTAGLLQFGYYGVANWMPAYLESEMGMDFKSLTGYLIGTYTASIVGKVLAGLAADWLGRRAVFCIGAVSASIFLAAIVNFHTQDNVLWMLVLFGFVYGIPYGVNATYMTESFSGRYRGCAIGGAYNLGRAGAAVAPIIIGYLATHVSIGMGFMVLGAAYLICGFVPALFIPNKQYDPQRE
ncbi:MFS transporter [Pseudomonas sp. TE21394]